MAEYKTDQERGVVSLMFIREVGESHSVRVLETIHMKMISAHHQACMEGVVQWLKNKRGGTHASVGELDKLLKRLQQLVGDQGTPSQRRKE